MRSTSTPCRILAGILGVALCPPAGQLAAQGSPGAAIVSANSYQQATRDAALIDVNAYHSHTCAELLTDLARQPSSKPILISDDGGNLRNCTALSNCPSGPGGAFGLDASCTKVFAAKIADDGQHFEHLSSYLSTHVEGGGSILSGWNDFSADDRRALENLRARATPLAANGTLTVVKDASGKGLFHWNGSPVTLMGFSFYGAVASNRVNAANYLDALKIGPSPDSAKIEKGVNLTRVWLTDMWTALDSGTIPVPPTGQPPAPAPTGGMTPFVENVALPTIRERYNPTAMSDAFFARLKGFVQLAWERGIVVQVTLFERNGVQNNRSYGYGGWWGSPYNQANNPFSILTDPPINQHPADFLSQRCDYSRGLGRAHRELTLRTLLELRGFGNVIFEILNEAEGGQSTQGEWDARLATWHEAFAQVMDDALTASPRLAWDRFDLGAPSASLHAQESLECTSSPWKAANAVYSNGTGRITNNSSSPASMPRGTVDLDYADLPTGTPVTVEIRGHVPQTASLWDTWLAVGFFSDNGSATIPESVFANGQLWMLIRQDGNWGVAANGTQIVLGTGQAVVPASALKTVQLRYDPVSNSASAWVNGVQVLAPKSLGSFHPTIRRAGFDSYAGGSVAVGSVQIDDFQIRARDTSAYGSLRVHWAQPQPFLGWGPPGSLVLAGSSFGPAGNQITLRWRNVTQAGPWITDTYRPAPSADGLWYHAIGNATYTDRYAIQILNSVGAVSTTCVYPGGNAPFFCP